MVEGIAGQIAAEPQQRFRRHKMAGQMHAPQARAPAAVQLG
jgi:hypothetical protein